MLSVFSSSKCCLFHNSNVFGSCIIHVLYTECAKIKKSNSGAKRLIFAFRHFRDASETVFPTVVQQTRVKRTYKYHLWNDS